MLRYVFVVLASLLLTACEQLPKLDYDTDYEFKDSYSFALLPAQKMDEHPVVTTKWQLGG